MDRAEGAPTAAGWLDVTVACSECPGRAFEICVRIEAGASTFDALRASGVLERFPTIDVSTAAVGVWGRVATLDTKLGQGDRIEIYRPLMLDPKEARRKRASQLMTVSRVAARRKKGSAGG